jgi:hypothetical protein
MSDTESLLAEMVRLIPALEKFTVTCPVVPFSEGFPLSNCAYPDFLSDIIIHLNDEHKWSRERIADWLDTLPVDLSFKAEIKEAMEIVKGPGLEW